MKRRQAPRPFLHKKQASPQYLSKRLLGKYFIYLPGSFSGFTAPLCTATDIAETVGTRPPGRDPARLDCACACIFHNQI
jgi:hypothetical protein